MHNHSHDHLVTGRNSICPLDTPASEMDQLHLPRWAEVRKVNTGHMQSQQTTNYFRIYTHTSCEITGCDPTPQMPKTPSDSSQERKCVIAKQWNHAFCWVCRMSYCELPWNYDQAGEKVCSFWFYCTMAYGLNKCRKLSAPERLKLSTFKCTVTQHEFEWNKKQLLIYIVLIHTNLNLHGWLLKACSKFMQRRI